MKSNTFSEGQILPILPKRQLKAINAGYKKFDVGLNAALKQHQKLEQAIASYKMTIERLVKQASETEMLIDTAIGSLTDVKGKSQLMGATKQMQEVQMSFNLQYLQLQSQMQHENRSYTAISNIMKTKHDTVKNSISNIR